MNKIEDSSASQGRLVNALVEVERARAILQGRGTVVSEDAQYIRRRLENAATELRNVLGAQERSTDAVVVAERIGSPPMNRS